jgi:hypothetical protein
LTVCQIKLDIVFGKPFCPVKLLFCNDNVGALFDQEGYFDGIFLFFNFVIVNPIRFAMEDKELLFSIDERDVVEEVGKLLRREKGKYYGNLDISVVSDGTINLFSGVVSWKELEKLKVLANYDFSLSSYPNPIGANLRWSVYEELKDAGLICDGKIKERIAEKVKELRGEQ